MIEIVSTFFLICCLFPDFCRKYINIIFKIFPIINSRKITFYLF